MLWSLLFFSLIAPFNTESIQLNGTETSQSSIYEDDNTLKYTSDRAIDGDVKICTNTKQQMNSWWRIDLMGVYRISSIEIFNKASVHSVINGCEIYIGYSPELNRTADLKFETIENFATDIWNTFKGNGNVSGRYITVIYPKEEPLVLCEVKINGTKEESPFVLIQENKTWEEALSHCRAQNMDLASILDANTQTLVGLEAMKATTDFVWLGLGHICILDFWFWVNDHCLTFEYWAPESGTDVCDVSAAMEKNWEHHWHKKNADQQLNFICAK
ncbi:fucolectin-like [Gymnodraco acuticeps]|uniref:Fucolectin-like n=1 Tax=Gymnodraco acuticeps TaxID=8218 RepID=A0A6P8THU2_GYMAC|nr:fucolectin-like [Gymnodraco acuticeps]